MVVPPHDMVHLQNDITWQGSDSGSFLTIIKHTLTCTHQLTYQPAGKHSELPLQLILVSTFLGKNATDAHIANL